MCVTFPFLPISNVVALIFVLENGTMEPLTPSYLINRLPLLFLDIEFGFPSVAITSFSVETPTLIFLIWLSLTMAPLFTQELIAKERIATAINFIFFISGKVKIL